MENIFVPKEQEIVVEGENAPLPDFTTHVEDDELKATVALAKVSAEPGFLELVQRQISWRGVCKVLGKSVVSDEEAGKLADHFAEMKQDLKSLEALRKDKVAFPTKVVGMINALFRQVREGIEKDKGKVGKLIADWNLKEKERVERLQREAEERKEKGEVVVTKEEGEEGVGKVQFGTPVPDLPGNVVESKRGAKVQMRSGLEVEVADLGEFLKVLVSNAEGNQWIAGERESVISVNIPEVKRLLKANPKRKKVKGLRIKKTSLAV